MDLFEHCLEIAVKAHSGQFRKDGQPYISHPKAVVSILTQNKGLNGAYFDIAACVGILHDVVEDSDLTLKDIFLELSRRSNDFDLIKDIIIGLWGVTKKAKHLEDYTAYLSRVKSNRFSYFVKLADLEHNLSDLQDGNLKDKYLVAQSWLRNIGYTANSYGWDFLFETVLTDKMK